MCMFVVSVCTYVCVCVCRSVCVYYRAEVSVRREGSGLLCRLELDWLLHVLQLAAAAAACG